MYKPLQLFVLRRNFVVFLVNFNRCGQNQGLIAIFACLFVFVLYKPDKCEGNAPFRVKSAVHNNYLGSFLQRNAPDRESDHPFSDRSHQ